MIIMLKLKAFCRRCVVISKRVVSLFVLPIAAVLVAVSFVTNVYAAFDLTDFVIDLSPVEVIVPLILVGLAAMWVVRKLVKTTNRT